MILIDSYEKFCKAFHGNADDIRRAELLLLLQDWIIRIADKIDDVGIDYSLDSLLVDNKDKSHLRFAKKDAISRLIDDSYDAIRRISDKMRENIIRENVKMPVYKVREVNSYGLNWLSRRPGTTIKEKISSSNSSMMAVQRRMSLDTGENRLFIAYVKELADALQSKLDNFPERQKSENEIDFYSQLLSIVRNPDNEEIRRWENMPPNNTLLSDQNYKKIWRCWNEIKLVDSIISEDNSNIDARVCTMFYIEVLTKGNQFFWFPQIPVDVDYLTYMVKLYSKNVFGIDAGGNRFFIVKKDNTIELSYLKNSITVDFLDGSIEIIENNKNKHTVEASISSINRYVDLVLTKLGCKKSGLLIERSYISCEKANSLIMDIFSVRPDYIADMGDIKKLNGRLLNQTIWWSDDDEQRKFEVNCDASNMIILNEQNETYSVSTAIDQNSSYQMTKLMHLMENYIVSQKFTFIFPDIYNEFQLSLVHKAARLVFHEVRSLPRSIGVAFSYMDSDSFRNYFSEGDYLLVMDIVDKDLSLTLVQGICDNTVEEIIPQYGGIIWERHPSLSYSLDRYISEDLFDRLIDCGCDNPELLYSLVGLNGLATEKGLLSVLSQEDNIFTISEKVVSLIKDFKINISSMVNEYLGNYKRIIGNKRVHIISLSPNLFYKGMEDFEFIENKKALEGCKLYEGLQANSKVTLWRDHLPELAIKLLYGKFNLVDNETITPEFNVEKKIQIKNIFSLVKGMKEYHFNLVQNDANRKIRYEAVVKNPTFPLDHDVECRLDMTYQYGAEEPYRLLFIPLNKNEGFVEAKVVWEKVKTQPYNDLNYPDSIHSLPWNKMYDYKGWNEQVDLISEMTNKLYAIGKGYQTFDFTGDDLILLGSEEGKRSFSIDAYYDNQPIIIIFRESNFDKNKYAKRLKFDDLGVVSFDLNEALSYNNNQRYSVDLRDYWGDRPIWVNRGNGYATYPVLSVDGQTMKIAFFANKFDHPEQFHNGITKVSFELEQYKDIYRAVNIHDESSGEPYQEVKKFFACNIRKGNVPGQFTYNGWMYFLMLTMFIGKNSFYDSDCPTELREAFEFARETWIDSFNKCEDDYVKMRMFNLMSLVAKDIGPSYYDISEKYIEEYINADGKLPDYIGYGVGECKSENEKRLFEKILKVNKERGVCILSKSIWGDEDFIWNVPTSITLTYFEEAIKYIKKMCGFETPSEKHITMCLEYILGTLRLRKYNDPELNFRLSMNNPMVRELYDLIENIIDRDIKVQSFLHLDVQNKGVYESIPDLLYALLVYLSGDQGAGDIKISGLELKDIGQK